jgi:dienelactone hydrolase
VTVIEGWEQSSFTHDGITHDVYKAGSGPAVIVVHEMPGLHPGVAAFARRVVDQGFTVWMPSLFGTPNKKVSVGYVMGSMSHGVCVSKELHAFALDGPGPVMGWMRALAAAAHAACGGPGVGALGMCFTGGFALGMMVDERMLAPVLSQPSLPFAVGKYRKANPGVSDADLERIKDRAARGACVMGLRFTADKAVPRARFDTLRRELGDAFIAIEIDSSKGNSHGIKSSAHSVLTLHLVDEPGHPTREALDRVLAFFHERLGVPDP